MVKTIRHDYNHQPRGVERSDCEKNGGDFHQNSGGIPSTRLPRSERIRSDPRNTWSIYEGTSQELG